MQWIGDWIKQIILLVLLATFVDLLLPNQALTRYVKLVMGLLIILAILSPVLNLLTDDLKLDHISMESLALDHEKSMPSVEQIKNKGEEIKKIGQEQVMESWKAQMSHTIEVDLENKFSLNVSRLDLKAQMKDHNPRITEVKLVVEESARGVQNDHPIEPIDFTTPPPVKRDDQQLREKVKQYLSHTWKIERAMIEIRARG